MLKNRTHCILFLVLFSFESYAFKSDLIVYGANEKLVEQYVAKFLLEDIYTSLGLNLEVRQLPPQRAMASNLAKVIDGEIARITPYGDNKPSLIRIEPSYYYLESAAYCLKESTININNKDDLAHHKVGVIRGVAHSEAAVTKTATVVRLTSARQLFDFLRAKRIDVVVDTEINGRRILKDKDYMSNIKRCGVFARYDLFNYINTNKKWVKQIVSKKIMELKKSGMLDEMTGKAEAKALSLGKGFF